MQSPLAATLDWFDQQQEDVRETIVLLVGGLATGNLSMDQGRMTSDFRSWLSPREDKFQEVSIVLHFRALFEFQLHGRITPEGQQEALRRLNQVRERALEGGPVSVESIDRLLADRPRIDALWTEAAKSWAELRDGPLSDGSLNRLMFFGTTEAD